MRRDGVNRRPARGKPGVALVQGGKVDKCGRSIPIDALAVCQPLARGQSPSHRSCASIRSFVIARIASTRASASRRKAS